MFRTRRLRKTEGIRRLVRENKLSVDDFVYPLFIEEGENIEKEIVSMPGIKRFSLDRISKELDEVVALDIPSVLLFGIPSEKDDEETTALVGGNSPSRLRKRFTGKRKVSPSTVSLFLCIS